MEESPHKCPVCSRSFNQRSNLKTHLLTHTDHKPYECNSCGKVFRRNCDLRRHALTHAVGDVPPEVLDVGEEDRPLSPLHDPMYDDDPDDLTSPDHSPVRRPRSPSNESVGRARPEEFVPPPPPPPPRRTSPTPERTECHHNEPRSTASPYTMRPSHEYYSQLEKMRHYPPPPIQDKNRIMRHPDIPESPTRHPQLQIRRDLHHVNPEQANKPPSGVPMIQSGHGMYLGSFRKRPLPPDITDLSRPSTSGEYRTRPPSPGPTNLTLPRSGPMHMQSMGLPPANLNVHKLVPIPPPPQGLMKPPDVHMPSSSRLNPPPPMMAQDLIIKHMHPKDVPAHPNVPSTSQIKHSTPSKPDKENPSSSSISPSISLGIQNMVGIQPPPPTKQNGANPPPKKGFSIEDIMRR